jgi:hypothetical protein
MKGTLIWMKKNITTEHISYIRINMGISVVADMGVSASVSVNGCN